MHGVGSNRRIIGGDDDCFHCLKVVSKVSGGISRIA